MSVPSNLF